MQKLLDSLFSLSLGLHLKGYEERKEQQEMAHEVLTAFQEKKIAFIEAGTGTGKSLAYLLPSFLFAKELDTPIVISTNTIALQEQLIQKDIPLALQVLGMSMKYVLAKGMGNYLCLRKLNDATREVSLFQEEFHEELLHIARFADRSHTGSRSDLPFMPSGASWEKVSCHTDACNSSQCDHFGKCFFFKARREAQEAKIIVVNHHLLFADLALRMESNNFSGPALLPAYEYLIIDEAHHIEDVAAEYFAEKVSRLELFKVLSQLSPDDVQGALSKLLSRVEFLHKRAQELSSKKRGILFSLNEFFDQVVTFCSLVGKEQKLRIRPMHLSHPFWEQKLMPLASTLVSELTSFSLLIEQCEQEVVSSKSETLLEQTKSLRLDIKFLNGKLARGANRLKNFFSGQNFTSRVYWLQIEKRVGGLEEVLLVQAQHDLSTLLRENIFAKKEATVLCSATLAANNSFSYIRSRLGLQEEPCVEKVFQSPFSYNTQALFGCPNDLPEPDSPEYLQALERAIFELIEVSRGNAFVLFTSYEQLKSIADALAEELQSKGYHLLKQGDDHRQALIRRFKEKPRSVLFGTDSFWEGVDIIGDALRLVIITKLPFAVPSDPLSEARSELLTAHGKSPFRDLSLPKAIVKFKQAFGRLIRHRDDRGSCICLDVRLVKRGYGKLFIKSLPECIEVFEPLVVLKKRMTDFYRMERIGFEPIASTMPLLRSTK